MNPRRPLAILLCVVSHMYLTLKHVFVICFYDATEDYLLDCGICFQDVYLISLFLLDGLEIAKKLN